MLKKFLSFMNLTVSIDERACFVAKISLSRCSAVTPGCWGHSVNVAEGFLMNVSLSLASLRFLLKEIVLKFIRKKKQS